MTADVVGEEEAAPGTLMMTTLKLLHESKESQEAIARGAGVSFYWLRKFAGGAPKDPSVNRVQKVYEYLTKSKLLPTS